MADHARVQTKVTDCMRLLEEHGIECSTTADDLIAWFQAETPYPDYTLDQVLDQPLLVVHELVEIDEVKKMGLKFTKDVILKNPEAVDRAHCIATLAELRMAFVLGDVEHVRSRMDSIASWIVDPLSTDENKAEYKRIHEVARRMLEASPRKE
jgi:hypothetical protein